MMRTPEEIQGKISEIQEQDNITFDEQVRLINTLLGNWKKYDGNVPFKVAILNPQFDGDGRITGGAILKDGWATGTPTGHIDPPGLNGTKVGPPKDTTMTFLARMGIVMLVVVGWALLIGLLYLIT